MTQWCRRMQKLASTSTPNYGHKIVTCRYRRFSFSPFAAVSLFGVAGHAETFPSFSVSGPFLLDFPGFQVASDGFVPPQLWSSSRVLPLHLHFCNCPLSPVTLILIGLFLQVFFLFPLGHLPSYIMYSYFIVCVLFLITKGGI